MILSSSHVLVHFFYVVPPIWAGHGEGHKVFSKWSQPPVMLTLLRVLFSHQKLWHKPYRRSSAEPVGPKKFALAPCIYSNRVGCVAVIILSLTASEVFSLCKRKPSLI